MPCDGSWNFGTSAEKARAAYVGAWTASEASVSFLIAGSIVGERAPAALDLTRESKNKTQSYDMLPRTMRPRRGVRSSRSSRRAHEPARPGPRNDGSAIELDRVAVRIGGRTIWSDVSMKMGRGEFVALLGANGSGKSTLLKVVLGALAPAAGEVAVLGSAPGAANRSIGYLPQRRYFVAG